MKKRLLSLVLALAICLGIVPTAVFAEVSQEPVSGPQLIEGQIEATIAEPVPGEKIPFEISVPEGAHYTAEITKWVQKAEPGTSESDITFFPQMSVEYSEARYRLHVTFKAADGFEFNPSVRYFPVIHIGDKEDWILEDCRKNTNNVEMIAEGTVYAGDAERLTTISNIVAFITGAVPGNKPDYTVQVPDNAQYTAEIVKWHDTSTGGPMDPEDTFQKDTNYFAEIIVTPKPGYEFPLEWDDIDGNVQDENGPVEIYYGTVDRNEYFVKILYDLGDPRLDAIRLKFKVPRPGTKAKDVSMPEIIPEEDKEKYYITDQVIFQVGAFVSVGSEELFEKGVQYECVVTAFVKDGYRPIDRNKPFTISVVDQYGQPLECRVQFGRVGVEFAEVFFKFTPKENYTVTFKVENGTWSDGSKEDKVIPIQINNNGIGFLYKEQIPTGMMADPDYVGGKWDYIPIEYMYEITEDKEFIYRFTHKDEHAVVTMKIVNGTWLVDPFGEHLDRPYHSDDIVVNVPLVNGTGTLDWRTVPNHIRSDPGCILEDWDVEPNTDIDGITEDVTYTYFCTRVLTEPLTYTLSYDANGGDPDSVPAPDSQTVLDAFCDFTVTTSVPTREGYKFTGWNTKADGSGRGPNPVWGIGLKYDNPNVTFYAQWEELEKRTVEFIAPDARPTTVPTTMTVYPDETGKFAFTVPESPVPERTDYLFEGYELIPVQETIRSKAASGPVLYQPGDTVVLGDADKYQMAAHWKEHIVTLTYDVNGGDPNTVPAAESKQTDIGVARFVISETVPTRDRYKFMGWKDQSFRTYNPGDVITLTDDYTLSASWEKSQAEYTVEHYLEVLDNPGVYSEVKSDTKVILGHIGDLTEAVPNNYDGFHVIPFEQKNIKWNDTTVVEIEYDRNKAFISFNGNGADGGTMEKLSVRYGEDARVIPANGFTRSGYHFIGWNMEADGSGDTVPDDAEINPSAVFEDGTEIVLYAQWEKDPDDTPDKPDVPDDKPDVPDDKPDGPDDKPDGPDDKPDGPDDKPDVPDDKPDVPDTGLSRNMVLWILMDLLSAGAIITALLFDRKRKNAR